MFAGRNIHKANKLIATQPKDNSIKDAEINEVEPPSAEKMLRRLRKKIIGGGLRTI